MQFTDRADAGDRLAERLRNLEEDAPVVLGLPRGGVPVAARVAEALGAPLDILLVRKLGIPSHREVAFGAIGEDGVKVVRDDITSAGRLREKDIASVERSERAELLRQKQRFRGGRPPHQLHGRTVILVDDGIATGATASAACEVARLHGAARVVLAVPVASPEAVDRLRDKADELVCLSAPRAFFAVGEWYRDFSQTSDEEVVSLLRRTGSPVSSDEDGATRYPHVVQAWDGHSHHRLFMFPDETYHPVRSRSDLEDLARQQNVDLDDPGQVVWEGGDRWPPPSS